MDPVLDGAPLHLTSFHQIGNGIVRVYLSSPRRHNRPKPVYLPFPSARRSAALFPSLQVSSLDRSFLPIDCRSGRTKRLQPPWVWVALLGIEPTTAGKLCRTTPASFCGPGRLFRMKLKPQAAFLARKRHDIGELRKSRMERLASHHALSWRLPGRDARRAGESPAFRLAKASHAPFC